MHLVRTGGAHGIEQLVRELGENPIALIESVGLRQAQFRDPDQYIAYHKLPELLRVCSEACDAPLFGLLLAQRQQTSVLGDLPMIASRATTVGEAIASINRFLYLHASGVRIEPEVRGERARIMLNILIGDAPGMDQLMQLSTAQEALYIAELLNADPYSQAIHLRQPAPAPAPSNGNLRFHNVRYLQDFDGVSFPGESLQRPAHSNEEALNQHLEGYLARLQATYPDNLESQVTEVIGRLLPSGECTVTEVASTLNLAPRTLQSQLRSRGTSYREILQETRCNLAIQRLSEDGSSITELALQLGYAEVAVFSRHFKCWTGLSPRSWREARRAGNTTPNVRAHPDGPPWGR